MASPRPTRCAPRSQAFSPCRGSGPDSRGNRPRRRGPAPVEPAAAAARCHDHQNAINQLARPLTARSRPRLRPRHSSAPRSSSVSTRTPVAGMPHAQLSCREQIVDGGAHERYAASRSPSRAVSRAVYTSTIGNSRQVEPLVAGTCLLTSARSLVRASCSASVSRGAPAQRPAVGGRHAHARSRRRIVRQSAVHPRSRASRRRPACSAPIGIA